MPIYEYECLQCGRIFELIVKNETEPIACEACGHRNTKKRVGAPAFRVATDNATPRIEKRVRDYLLDGKFSEASRFADKAASMVKSDKVKQISDTLHKKTNT
jgi:putative FmdB family regulatory protein